MKLTTTKRLALAVAGLALTGLAACTPEAEGSAPKAEISETAEAPAATVPEAPAATVPEAPAATVPEAPAATVPETPEATTEEAAAGETVSQENARESAASYLDTMAFSHSGLVEQLEFEGFTPADATYGVDALNADWNEQAAKSAASYLDTMAFSHSGLVDQLVFEGYTQEQAEYGVGTTGL